MSWPTRWSTVENIRFYFFIKRGEEVTVFITLLYSLTFIETLIFDKKPFDQLPL